MKYIKLKPLTKAEQLYIKMMHKGPHPKAIIKEEFDKAERQKKLVESDKHKTDEY